MGGFSLISLVAFIMRFEGDLVKVIFDSIRGRAPCLGLECCAQVIGCRERFLSNQVVGTTEGR